MTRRIESALDKAKSLGCPPWKEPVVSSNHVLLRDLVNVLEILWSFSDDQFEKSDGIAAARVLHESITSGELKVRVYWEGEGLESGPIIPRSAWPVQKDGDGHLSMFWLGSIRYPQDCHGYEGRIPYVPRD